METNRPVITTTKRPDRRCGECTLCCTLLPVKALDKGAGQRCDHQRGLGCNIYEGKGFPIECRMWNCRWLVDETTDGMERPDRAHYVIDIVPDFVRAQTVDGREDSVPVFQVWVDPRFPNAHEDPKLRAWVEAQPGMAVLVRYNSSDALFLLPPNLSSENCWEVAGGSRMRLDLGVHSAEQIFAELHKAGVMK